MSEYAPAVTALRQIKIHQVVGPPHESDDFRNVRLSAAG
jgi:hypothetical protein